MTSKSYCVSKAVSSFIFRRLYDVKVNGIENIPEEPAILALNQSSSLDAFVFGAHVLNEIDLPISFVYRPDEGWWFRPIEFYLKSIGCIRLPANSNGAIRDLQKEANRIFEKGYHLGIFPEGRRIRYEKLGKFYNGAAQIAIENNKPIVPIFMTDIYRTPLLGKIDINIGKPVISSGRCAKNLTGIVKQCIEKMSDYE